MENVKIIVGLGSCGIAAGAGKVYDEIVRIKEADNLNFDLAKTSCVGMCFREPLVEIIDETGSYLYGDVDVKRIDEIIDKHIVNFSPIKEYIVKSDMFDTTFKDYFEEQVKITLRNCGNIDPEHITEYENNHGYQAKLMVSPAPISIARSSSTTCSAARPRRCARSPASCAIPTAVRSASSSCTF